MRLRPPRSTRTATLVPVNTLFRSSRRPNKSGARPRYALAVRAAFDLRLAISREGGTLRLKRIPIAVDATPLRIAGTVGSSLYRAARAAGVPANLVADFIKIGRASCRDRVCQYV